MDVDPIAAAESGRTTAEFTIDLTPGTAELDRTGRFDFTKVWTGGMAGSSRGFMLSAGDPQSGNAGYVALEVFEGSVDGRAGTFALQQFGTMSEGASVLHYEIVPGSGTDGLVGITGTVELTVSDGRHDVTLRYRHPQQ
ncbi:MAG TPA: DUF3224 domain-containing protein [Kineosporiaceae bacterium]|nr:DUF3224 domain-containing protein [Kineosporiaceae bacterium]